MSDYEVEDDYVEEDYNPEEETEEMNGLDREYFEICGQIQAEIDKLKDRKNRIFQDCSLYDVRKNIIVKKYRKNVLTRFRWRGILYKLSLESSHLESLWYRFNRVVFIRQKIKKVVDKNF